MDPENVLESANEMNGEDTKENESKCSAECSSVEDVLSSEDNCLSPNQPDSYNDSSSLDECAIKELGNSSNPDASGSRWYFSAYQELIKLFKPILDWCIGNKLVRDSSTSMAKQWKTHADGTEYWSCTEVKGDCEKIPVKDTPFVYDDIMMDDVALVLYIWWRNCSVSKRRKHNFLSIEDNDHFDSTLREICIFGCKKQRSRIGGENIAVNVEIVLRMGTSCRIEIVIGGIETHNYEKFFLTCLTLENQSDSEIRKNLEVWIDPKSEVSTSSAILSPFRELCWKERENWTLLFNTGCLAEDLLRQRLICSETPFEELSTIVSEYFSKSRIRVDDDLVFDTIKLI